MMDLTFSSPLFLYLFLSISGVQGIVSDTYVLDTSYSGTTFFDDFDFWTDPDPTNGFVSYQSHASSLSKSLISTSNNVAHIGVDHTTTLSADGQDGGRESVRISSKKKFTHGLFLADIKHMPGNICGAVLRSVVACFGDTCTISGANSLGTLQSNDCNQNHGYGCSITSSSSISYGSSFNTALGGVYATQWTSDYIRIWFFPRESIPTNILSGEPDPSTWGLPDANFQGNCDVDGLFKDHQIVFDTTFCGDWAGGAWSGDEVCNAKAGTCQEFVASNPEAFVDAYWDINYVKVFTLTNSPPPATTKVLSSSKVASVPVSEPTSSEATSSKAPSVSTSTSKVTSTTQRATTSKPPFTLQPSSPTISFPPFPTSPHNSSIPILPNWSYIGCLSSVAVNVPRFAISLESNNMTNSLCASACSNSAYSATLDTFCYCGNEMVNETLKFSIECSTPCPGSWTQPCGGYGDSRTKKKRARLSHQEKHDPRAKKPRAAFVFFTVYQNKAVVLDPINPSTSQSYVVYPTPDPSEVHFVPSTGEIPTPLTSPVPASTLIGIPMGGSVDITSTSTHINVRSVTTNPSVSPKGTLIGIGMGGGLNTSSSTSTLVLITSPMGEILAESTYTTVITISQK
ncbi:hypothetical protein VTL71DRAFT_9034 [Oculimacula yallundae]|uniref:WSC domain-containing protein n=1 Tax=Oculimacula yallundae TaxID=86028 RepID=A0ABR4BTL0_9HELO